MKGVAKGERFFDNKMWMCAFVASMCLTACLCAFLSLTLLTLSRYVYICHNHLYDKFFNRVSCIIMCFCCWLTAFLFDIPNFTGWGGHYFDQKNHQCIWDRTASLSYTMLIYAGLIGPFVIMAICNLRIFQQIWKTKRDLYKLDSDNPLQMRKVWNETIRSSKTLFCIFIAFIVLWTPYATTVPFDAGNNLSTETHLFFTLLAHFHSSVNFIIYTTGNKRFQKGIFRLIGGRSSIKSESTSNPVETAERTRRSSSTLPPFTTLSIKCVPTNQKKAINTLSATSSI